MVVCLEICKRSLSPSLSLSWLSWPTVCGTHSSSQYLCVSVYLFILPLTGPYVGAICPPKSLRSPSLPVYPRVPVSSAYSRSFGSPADTVVFSSHKSFTNWELRLWWRQRRINVHIFGQSVEEAIDDLHCVLSLFNFPASLSLVHAK